MGYTHYFYTAKEFSPYKWNKFCSKMKKLLEGSQKVIQKEYDDNSAPSITSSLVRFNGIGDDGHETFVLERVYTGWQNNAGDNPHASCFSFCKTARKPYDKYVTATLLLGKLVFGEEFEISSDGDISDWEESLKLLNEKLGIVVTITPNEKYPEDIAYAVIEEAVKV